MKRLLLLVLLLLTLTISARAVDVTVSSFSPQFSWPYGGTTATVRVYVSAQFLTANGEVIQASPVGGTGFYKVVTCSISGTTLTVPSFSLPGTDDGRPNTSRYTLIFFDKNGTKRDVLFSNYRWPIAYGSTMTVAQLVVWNTTAPAPPRPGFPDTVQVQQLINARTPAPMATTTLEGIGRVSVDPANPLHPIFPGDNDPRINEDYNASSFTSLSAAVAAMPSSGATLVVSTSMAANGVTVPAYVHLKLTGAGQLTGSGTVTIVGAFEAPENKQVFASTLTVSFSGNKTLTTVRGEWWGALATASATTNASAFNASLAALATNNGNGSLASGTLQLGPGRYSFNSTLIVGSTTGGGDGLGAFSAINIQGTGSIVDGLVWTGSTAGTAIKITRGRNNHFADFLLFNGGVRGTTTGILETGPAQSMQTHGVHYDRMTIEGFGKGIASGDPAVGASGSASEMSLFTRVDFVDNTYGWYAGSNFNSIAFTFEMCDFQGNDYGVYTITGFQITLTGCAGGENAVYDLYVSGNGNVVTVNGWDSESGAKFITTPNNARAILNGITLRSYTLARTNANALIETFTSKVTINGIYQGPNANAVGSTGAHLVYSSGGDVEIANFLTTDTYPIWISPGDSGSDGTRVTVGHGALIDNTSGATLSSVQEASGSIVWPNFNLITHNASGQAGTSITPPQISTNTDNYAPVNASTGTAFPCSTYLRLSTDASRNITGLLCTPTQIDGQTTTIINMGAQNIILKNETTSTAANRFHATTGADITLTPDQRALLVYDAAISRWRVSNSSDAATLNGATFAAPGAIGGGTPAAVTGTSLTGTSLAITGTPISSSSTMLLGAPMFLYTGGIVSGTVGTSTTTYITPGNTTTGSESTRQTPMPASIVRNLRINLLSTSPAAGTVVVTVRKNGVDTAVTITITAGTTTAVLTDLTHTATFAASDKLSISVTNNDASNTFAILGSVITLEAIRQ